MFVLCVNNGYRNTFQQAKCDEPALAIRETIVLESERRAGEDPLCVNEVDVVSLQITSTLLRSTPGCDRQMSAAVVSFGSTALRLPLERWTIGRHHSASLEKLAYKRSRRREIS